MDACWLKMFGMLWCLVLFGCSLLLARVLTLTAHATIHT